jgi:L-lactate utilization protein LutB
MGKTSGNKAEAKRQTQASLENEKKQTTVRKKAGAGVSQKVIELQNELAAAQQRAQDLESANQHVADRLEVMIQSVKAILEKQG